MVEEGLKKWRKKKRRRRKGRKKKEEEERKERRGGGREKGVKGRERKREKEGEREEREKRTGSGRGKGHDKVKKNNVGMHEKGGESGLCKAVGVWAMISVCVGVHTGMNNNGGTCKSSRL